MQVILLERVEKLGAMGETVRVKDGYARNFLLPRGKALRATEANMAKFEAQRAELEAKNAAAVEAAKTDAEKLDGSSYVLIRQAGESGQLYGSVSTRDIAAAASDSGVSVNRNQVVLADPIKTIGIYDVKVALHGEVSCTVQINVARTQDEAEAQARGEDLTGNQDEREEIRRAAEELFEQAEADALAEEGEEAGEDAADATKAKADFSLSLLNGRTNCTNGGLPEMIRRPVSHSGPTRISTLSTGSRCSRGKLKLDANCPLCNGAGASMTEAHGERT
jgi:large subunit ribosomal protein L9